MLSARLKLHLQFVTVLFAVVSAAATCVSTYFAYKTINLYSEQNERERRKEYMAWIDLATGVLNGIAEDVKKNSLNCSVARRPFRPLKSQKNDL